MAKLLGFMIRISDTSLYLRVLCVTFLLLRANFAGYKIDKSRGKLRDPLKQIQFIGKCQGSSASGSGLRCPSFNFLSIPGCDGRCFIALIITIPIDL